LRREQRIQRRRQCENQRERFIAVEDPAEIAAPQHAPMPAGQARIPGRGVRDCGDLGHGSPRRLESLAPVSK
jgi:hypothetical protein